MEKVNKVGEHAFILPHLEVILASGFDTFSVGVFAWVPTKAGDGLLKRGPAKVRISGMRTRPGYEAVRLAATRIAKALDAGTYTGPKILYLPESSGVGEPRWVRYLG